MTGGQRGPVLIRQLLGMKLGRQAMEIAADICVYTNSNFSIEKLDLND